MFGVRFETWNTLYQKLNLKTRPKDFKVGGPIIDREIITKDEFDD